MWRVRCILQWLVGEHSFMAGLTFPNRIHGINDSHMFLRWKVPIHICRLSNSARTILVLQHHGYRPCGSKNVPLLDPRWIHPRGIFTALLRNVLLRISVSNSHQREDISTSMLGTAFRASSSFVWIYHLQSAWERRGRFCNVG